MPAHPVALVQNGTCQPEADPCTGGGTCCSAAPGLFCQKSSALQLLGTCKKVSSGVCALMRICSR